METLSYPSRYQRMRYKEKQTFLATYLNSLTRLSYSLSDIMIWKQFFVFTLLVLCVKSSALKNATYRNPCDQDVKGKNITLAVFSIAVLCTGIIGNSTVLITISYSRFLREQPSYVVLSSLAIADLGVSVFVTTFKVDMYLKNGSFCHSFDLCAFLLTADTVFPIASITHLMIIASDRFYAINSPYSYQGNVTRGKHQLITFFVWMYAITWTSLGFFGWESPYSYAYLVIPFQTIRYCISLNKYYYTTVSIVVYLIPMAITTFLYTQIFKVSYASNLKIWSSIYKTTLIRNRSYRIRLMLHSKASKLLSAIFLAYVVCWLPNFVTVVLSFWFPSIFHIFHANNPMVYDILTTIISNILPPLNSCINPFIYFLSNTIFRRAFRDVVDKIQKNSRGHPQKLSRQDAVRCRYWKATNDKEEEKVQPI